MCIRKDKRMSKKRIFSEQETNKMIENVSEKQLRKYIENQG